MKRRLFLLAAVTPLIVVEPLPAKCSFRPVSIRIMTTDACSGGPIPNVSLTIFINDDSYDVELEPSTGTTDQRGTFDGRLFFSTYSGSGPGGRDQCGRRLTSLTVFVTRQGYGAMRIGFAGKQLRAITKGNGKIELPAIEMVPER